MSLILHFWNSLLLRRSVFMHRLFGKVPLPTVADVDASSACSLHCPLCATGQRLPREGASLMPLQTFKRVLQLFTKLKALGLVVSGEPFLNPSFFEMVKQAKAKGIAVRTHSHFSFQKDISFFEQIVQSGLDLLYLSIDGATAEAYNHYRVGGNFELVLANIEKLQDVKQRLQSKSPKVIWKFIVMKENENEISKAKAMAEALGVGFETSGIYLGEDLFYNSSKKKQLLSEKWLPQNIKYRLPYYSDQRKRYPKAICPHLFNRPAVNPNGKIFPCCRMQGIGSHWGDLLTQSLDEIWHSEIYKNARDRFIPGRSKEKVPFPCSHCTAYSEII